MDMNGINKFDEIAERFRNATTLEERQQCEADWWACAIGAFNEHIAGTITLADGRTMTIPTI